MSRALSQIARRASRWGPRRIAREVQWRVTRLWGPAVRRLLHAYATAAPRPGDSAGAERRVLILLMSAWGMGGTIRAAHNLAGHLAAHGYEVEIASIFRLRGDPFFGSFPGGVKVTALDDHRPEGTPRALRPLRWLLRQFSSVLVNPADHHVEWWNLWVDVRLARLLRRRTGILVTTRPSLNLIAAQHAGPGLITVGLEQINLRLWKRRLKKAMGRYYPNLDVLVALTEGDVAAYDKLLKGRLRLERIPNTVHAMGGPDPDLSERTLVAAGRLTHQKGFDLLIPAFAQIARDHPGWKLRIHGKGQQRDELKQLIAQHGLKKRVDLAGPAQDMGAEMAKASIFVLSSRFEGFPLILIEAMSKGLAVVSFDCPTGPSDIIDDHRNGILVPNKDVDALARGMSELMGDEDKRRRYAAAAVETSREYSIDAIGPRWEALFASLHRSRNGTGG
jgi:glycosyltransferase involved in cell wall biosynthesis